LPSPEALQEVCEFLEKKKEVKVVGKELILK